MQRKYSIPSPHMEEKVKFFEQGSVKEREKKRHRGESKRKKHSFESCELCFMDLTSFRLLANLLQ